MKKSIDFIRNGFLYGGDYNPDQWLDRPDVLKEDLRLMKKSGVNVVSLGIFAWSALEPEEGVFRFEWLDRVFDDLNRSGIRVFLATPSGARPGWMAAKYPEVLRVGSDGKRNLFGIRHNHCFSSPVYREKTAEINGKLAERYASHPAVILWHISNEYSGGCHCELCQENFRNWLKNRYGDLDSLNKAWWNAFWSHTVTDWNHIHSPVPHGEPMLHGLNLDWKRFVTDMTVDFMEAEIAAVHTVRPDLPVTTNLMAGVENSEHDPGLDYWKFRDKFDFASWDSYPGWHLPGYQAFSLDIPESPVDDYRRASEVAFQHDLFRSLTGGPFLLMESTPSAVNWRPLSKPKKPGLNILSGLQAVAHGANSVQYFQWRKSRGGFEKYHGAVVGHDGTENTRIFREAAELGSLLDKMRPIADTDYPARTALVYNWENRWVFEDSRGALNGPRKAYLETVRKHYFCLWDSGVPMDIISGEEDLSGYDLVVAPMLHMVGKTCEKRIREFVEAGGLFFTTYQSGYVDESDLCFEGAVPGPLRDILGITCEELDVLNPREQAEILPSVEMESFFPNGTGIATDFCEVVQVQSARSLARFRGSLADGAPALTVNDFGKGSAWYLAGRLDADSLKGLYRHLIKRAGTASVHDRLAARDETVSVQVRSSGDKKYLFLMNFAPKEAVVRTVKSYMDFLNPGEPKSEWILPGWGVAILE